MPQAITVYGAGYVGLVTSACLAALGHDVLCADINEEKIQGCLHGRLPIYEDGLDALVSRMQLEKRLTFTTDLSKACAFGVVQFIAVGTPALPDGGADLTAYWRLIDHIAEHAAHDMILVNKSTVPVGTADRASQKMVEKLSSRGVALNIPVASNPEFLKQGTAVKDFMEADRIVLGVSSEEVQHVMEAVYAPLIAQGVPCFVVGVASAEMIKYAANAFLATKISFMNELSAVAEKVGADIGEIRDGMRFDARIAPAFLNAGCGYGGSCFPKDVQALSHIAKACGCNAEILTSVHAANERQKQVLFEKADAHFKQQWSGKRVAVWGLAFKPGTDDLREAPSQVLMEALWAQGVSVTAYDPVAAENAQKQYAGQDLLAFANEPLEALKGADALFILTEWDVFQTEDLEKIKSAMAQPVVFDGRNVFDPAKMREVGFTYFSVGR